MGIRTPLDGPAAPGHTFGAWQRSDDERFGYPVAGGGQSLTAGPNGPTPLQDAYLV
jgi:hypothetical protein